MRLFIWMALMLVSASLFAADKKYPVSEIPLELLKNAHAVKRMENIRIELVSSNKTVVRRTYAITVLDRDGAGFAALEEPYDKLKSVRSIDGWLYDAAGNELRKLKTKEIEDRSAISNISIYEDSRVKRHSFGAPAYPYTVVYDVEVQYNHSFYLESWYPQEAENVSVMDSRFSVVTPAAYNLRFKAVNYSGAPQVTTEGSKQVRTWQVKNLKPIVRPFAAPLWQEMATIVYLAPSEFQIEGFNGVMSSWQDLGAFHAQLNKGRDMLPPNIQAEVVRITTGLKTDREKAEALYKYLQQNTRYISIQLGIGGWQPFEASFVAQKGYGDCKALSNYMYSLLKAAGIKSHYAIIRAGNSKEARNILEDFPMKQSNHVILCVPLQRDSLWLECTSQTESAGYLGSFTGNRKALLVDEAGGRLVNTPRYGLAENLQLRTITGKLDGETGNLQATVVTQFAAIQQDEKQQVLEQTTKEELKKSLNEDLGLATYDVVNFSYEQKRGALPHIVERLDLAVNRYATVSGKRLFILPNLLNKAGSPYIAEPERKFDFFFDLSYRDVDSVAIELPEGYTLEALPAPVSLKTDFGLFKSEVKLTGNKLLYRREREQYAGRYKPEKSADIAQFYAAMHKADNARVVFVKKE
ncbi:DUF3857 domain-containing transglutaminase family protein [Pseudocnuella soli]|uniref:DUF3857 domain-containing transglutaminase family protein n=1 Tax=Pseudocnuella soli TaxID=2502779 RepID=UPI00104D1CB1|nr:DUF3857 domain-containing transglutaminase family protein [Pseudocnuella soli]